VKHSRLIVLAVLVAGIAAFFAFGGHDLLRPENLKALLARVQGHFQARPLPTGIAFFLAYVAVTGLSLPGAAVMTLRAGAV